MNQNIWHKTFLDNPIVLRDLRSTMRGTRAFWFQGIYLGLLGILAVTGYAMSTGQSIFTDPRSDYASHARSIVDAQSQLQKFYYFIFVTLAVLITLIAPALTATSVSDERQRQSLDLLTTTPLSANEMLIGKLMSSLAFLGVLLALSLPASALCVLLGGASLLDMLRVYAMLTVDAVVLAAIGLYFSCACKQSLPAIIWTYVTVAVTTYLASYIFSYGTGYQMYNSVGTPNLAAVAGALTPISAVFPAAGQSLAFGAVHIPIWLAMLPVAFLVVRLLLTAAAYRFGTFGAESGRSLRKQLLLLTGIAGLAAGYLLKGVFAEQPSVVTESTPTSFIFCFCMYLTTLFAVALPFLPGLFVPVKAEDAPPGDAQEAHTQGDNGFFRFSALLLPRHAGALPYFYTWLGIAALTLFIGIGRYTPAVVGALLTGTFYAVGAGTLLWGLSRLAARLISSASSARALAFGLFILLNAIPMLPFSLITLDRNVVPPLAYLGWLGTPFLWMSGFLSASDNALTIASVLVPGAVALLLGLGIGVASEPSAE